MKLSKFILHAVTIKTL